MISKVFISALLILPAIRSAAQDLLANGGFEDENICTEYKINCAPEAWISSSSGFDNYFKDDGRAYEGSHCMAIEAGHARIPFQRTFIRSQLLCSLKKGNQYRLEFFIKSPHDILDSVGVYFGSIDPLLERKPIHLLSASLFLVDNTANQFRKDSSWQKAVLDYTAIGEESFITIANFSRNDITGPTGIAMENHFFVYLDNVSLIPLDPDEKLCTGWQQTKKDLYDQNERHEFLQRSIKYRASHPSPVILMPTIVVKTDTLLLPDVLFASGKAILQKESFGLLDSFVHSLTGRQIDSMVIEGHTDNQGGLLFNQQLSRARAIAVANYIGQKAHLSPQYVIIRSWDSQKPVADNRTPAGRRENRRVEVLLYTHE
jgi:outer membrane protein OmpA-like peptidoglycan-associated protein